MSHQPSTINRESDDPRTAVNEIMSRSAIVLVEPKFEENIGAAARVAMNMGIGALKVVGERPLDRERMLKMATHKAARLIEEMECHRDCAAALAEFSLVVGTTARTGRQRKIPRHPREIMTELAPLMKENRLAMVFGPEDRGLENEHLKLCHHTSTIPTADFSSLNLAQAVAIHAYELRTAVSERIGSGLPFKEQKLATTFELEGMYEHLETVLRRIGFLKDRGGRDAYWMNSIRAGFSRLGLNSREVRIVRGFCRQFLWYDRNDLRNDPRTQPPEDSRRTPHG